MFLVVNKEKLSSYIVSIATVLVLFVMAGVINQEGNTIETSVNIQNEIKNTTKDRNENNTSNEIINKNTYEIIEKIE